jgi:tRNA(fMet)-specific endonuclease VapC
MTYSLDTNIITAILKGNDKVKKRAQKSILKGEKIFISAISYYEIKRGLLCKNATTQLRNFDAFCKQYGLMLFDTRDIFDKAAEIYADLQGKGKFIGGDADILIASVVILRNFILVSNDAHFNRIQGLKLENWLN